MVHKSALGLKTSLETIVLFTWSALGIERKKILGLSRRTLSEHMVQYTVEPEMVHHLVHTVQYLALLNVSYNLF